MDANNAFDLVIGVYGWEPDFSAGHGAGLGHFDYFFADFTKDAEPLFLAACRIGRLTALTFPLFCPPQKN